MVSSYPSFASRLTQTVIAIALFSSVLWMTTADAGPLSIALRGARAFPESITSARDGTLFIGRLGDGGIIRANPRTGKASLFVAPRASDSRSTTGVFADEASKTLRACSNDLTALGGNSGGRDRGSALKGFDRRTSAPKLSVPLPGPNAFCNDIAVDARGAVYVTDSAAPSVFRLPARASTFEVFASNPQFLPPKVGSAGLDGIAFGGDGNLYVTTYAVGGLFRIDVDHGRAGRVTKLHGALLTLPDGLRPLGQRSFLLVEGAGTLDRVDVEGDAFKATSIRGGFRTPTSVTRAGSTAWVSEGQLSFFFDRARKGQSPSLPFRIYAVPLSKGQTQ